MNRALVDPIANAVLYEGHILYPYRPSVKNRQRWTFGGLYPEAYCRTSGGDASANQTECLVQGNSNTAFESVVRFLHISDRIVGEVVPPLPGWPDDKEPPFRPVASLRIGDNPFHSWQEAEEREVDLGELTVGGLSTKSLRHPFSFPAGRRFELLRGADGEVRGVLVRERRAVEGAVEVAAVEVAEGVFRLTLRVMNLTIWEGTSTGGRDDALLRSLVSTHAILGVRGGEFVSLMDPPECRREAAAACRNVGTWPVLVGVEGRNEMMLSSPIILYDHPQVAPESPGEFFDGTEIDEMLTLRVMTMTDEEKDAMAAVDGRTRDMLARVQGIARGQMLSLHGTVRGLRDVSAEGGHGLR